MRSKKLAFRPRIRDIIFKRNVLSTESKKVKHVPHVLGKGFPLEGVGGKRGKWNEAGTTVA